MGEADMTAVFGLIVMVVGLIAMVNGGAPLFEPWTLIDKVAPVAHGLSDAAYALQEAKAADENKLIFLSGAVAWLSGLIIFMGAVVRAGARKEKLFSGTGENDV